MRGLITAEVELTCWRSKVDKLALPATCAHLRLFGDIRFKCKINTKSKTNANTKNTNTQTNTKQMEAQIKTKVKMPKIDILDALDDEMTSILNTL